MEVERQDDPDGNEARGPGVDEQSSIGYLDQSLWHQIAFAPTPNAFAKAWLALQCAMISGVRRAVILLVETPGEPPVPAGRWPEDDVEDLSALIGIAATAVSRGRGVAKRANPTSIVGYPVMDEERPLAVAALELEATSKLELRVVMRQLQWGSAWIRSALQSGVPGAEKPSQHRMVVILEQVANALEYENFKAAAGAVATEVAEALDCERLSIGFAMRDHVDPLAISHSADFGKRSNLVRAIGAAMDEAVDQRETLLYPSSDPNSVSTTIAHAALAEEGGGRHMCTVPFLVAGEFKGAWTAERVSDRPFDTETVRMLQYLASVVGPVLELKRREEIHVGLKLLAAIRRQMERLLGPAYFGRKSFAILAASLALFFTFYTTTFRVGADASLEGQVQRVIASPMNSYIGEVNARAGDLVDAGDLLLSLDDRDLRLEQIKWETRKAQLERSRQDAMGRQERAESRIYKAQVDQAEAELRLINEQISRTMVRAPFNGIVVSGDLSQSLGAPVERGEVLMEVAPLDAYRVSIAVDERDISHIEVGQTGELILPSVPNRTFGFEVTKITPVASADQGKNTFRVEADLLQPSDALRPGMEGTAKIDIGERKLIWIWTRRFTEWLRVWVWGWWY